MKDVINFLNKLYNSSFNWGCFEIKSETLNFLIKILYFLNYFNSPSLKIIINHSLFHTTCNKLGSLSLSLITSSSFMGVIIVNTTNNSSKDNLGDGIIYIRVVMIIFEITRSEARIVSLGWRWFKSCLQCTKLPLHKM